jgi:nicotinamide-nucleotide amidase
MKSHILTIGDELLIGQVINTNASFIAQKLNGAGIEVAHMSTVGDDMENILAAFTSSCEQFDITIVTGGLGPTHDDITRSAVCTFFKTDLVRNESVLENIKNLMSQRGAQISAVGEDQAMVPRGATVVPNVLGTAPGLLFEREQKYFVVMPGVPHEMERMMTDTVAPFFASRTKSVVVHRTLKTTGITESALSNSLGNIDDLLQGTKLAFLPSPLGVRLRISLVGTDEAATRRRVAEVEQRIRAVAEKHIYGTDEEELEEVLGKMLAERKLTIAVAESCTGGMIADKLTNVPGSSRYFERGVVTYSNESKTQLLGVPAAVIAQHGAVSKAVAEAMAAGLRSAAKTDIAVSTTGIAGPDGGTLEKPVGLVYIGYADSRGGFSMKFQFATGRRRIKERASQAALELVRRRLLGIE